MMSAFGKFLGLRHTTVFQRRRNDDDVAKNQRRRSVHQVADGRIEVGILLDFLREIDNALLAKRNDRMAILRIQRHQLIAGRHGEDSRLLPIGPIRNAPAVLANSVGARPFVEPPRPERFPVPGSAATTARRSPAVKYRTPPTMIGVVSFLISGWAAEVIAVPDPGDLEVLDVGGVDLIERRISSVAAIAARAAPFAHLRVRPAEQPGPDW